MEDLKRHLADFMEAVRKQEERLKGLPERIDPDYYRVLELALQVLPAVHQTYDRYVETVLKVEGRKITCKSKCAACCSHYVTSVEPFEILAIHLRIRNSEQYPDVLFASHARVSKFEQLLKKEGVDDEAEDRALYRYFLRGAPCPFLSKDGDCGIYESRPMACRMFFSESAPRYCSGKELASPWNKNFQVQLPDEGEEALARCSELLAGLELPEGLFPGLLEANALFGKYET